MPGMHHGTTDCLTNGDWPNTSSSNLHPIDQQEPHDPIQPSLTDDGACSVHRRRQLFITLKNRCRLRPNKKEFATIHSKQRRSWARIGTHDLLTQSVQSLIQANRDGSPTPHPRQATHPPFRPTPTTNQTLAIGCRRRIPLYIHCTKPFTQGGVARRSKNVLGLRSSLATTRSIHNRHHHRDERLLLTQRQRR